MGHSTAEIRGTLVAQAEPSHPLAACQLPTIFCTSSSISRRKRGRRGCDHDPWGLARRLAPEPPLCACFCFALLCLDVNEMTCSGDVQNKHAGTAGLSRRVSLSYIHTYMACRWQPFQDHLGALPSLPALTHLPYRSPRLARLLATLLIACGRGYERAVRSWSSPAPAVI